MRTHINEHPYCIKCSYFTAKLPVLAQYYLNVGALYGTIEIKDLKILQKSGKDFEFFYLNGQDKDDRRSKMSILNMKLLIFCQQIDSSDVIFMITYLFKMPRLTTRRNRKQSSMLW